MAEDNTYSIESNQTASALFEGFADIDFAKPFRKIFNGLMLKIGGVLDATDRALSKIPGWDFFKGWFAEDPVGATAGAILGGVLIAVGGKIVASVSGGALAAFKAARIATKLKMAFAALTAAGVVGSLIRFAVRGTQYLWNFNWNETDTQIRDTQKALVASLYGQFGAALGAALGTLFCGAAPVELAKRTNLVKVNPGVLAKMKEISEGSLVGDEVPEIYEEMVEQTKALLATSSRVLTQVVFKETYKNVRKWIKAASKRVGLGRVFPGLATLIAKWGEEGSTPWTFASAIEEAIEEIKDPNIQNFTEELVENFMDTCTENLMIVSYAFG